MPLPSIRFYYILFRRGEHRAKTEENGIWYRFKFDSCTMVVNFMQSVHRQQWPWWRERDYLNLGTWYISNCSLENSLNKTWTSYEENSNSPVIGITKRSWCKLYAFGRFQHYICYLQRQIFFDTLIENFLRLEVKRNRSLPIPHKKPPFRRSSGYLSLSIQSTIYVLHSDLTPNSPSKQCSSSFCLATLPPWPPRAQ